MKKQFLKTALISMAVVGVLAGGALAGPILGGISMSGAWTPILANGTATTIPLATGIDFLGISDKSPSDNKFLVNSATGSFDGMPLDLAGEFTTGTINNFQFDSFTPVLTPLWSVGGFSFVMSSLSYEKDLADGNALIIRGKGTMSGNHFDVTPGSWIFTSQGASGQNFAWSASGASASPVPEPATMLLFGTGLMGLAFIGRRIRE